MAPPPTTTMHKALTMKKIEGKPGEVWYPLQIQSVPTPTPGPEQLLLRPAYVALNHRDLFLRQHLYPSPSFTTPLLADAVCTVLSSPAPSLSSPSPSSSVPSPPSSRVLLNPGHGWLRSPLGPELDVGGYAILGGTRTNPLGVAQDLLVVDKDEVVACPEHLSGPEAAALPLCGLTAWRALVTKAGVINYSIAERLEGGEVDGEGEGGNTYDGTGKNLLVTGIGGGVALMVLLFAVSMGVRVWVSSGEGGKVERARGLGACGGVGYREGGWERKLKTMLPKDRPYLDAIIDGAGGDIAIKAAKLLKPGGILVSYGMTLAPTLAVPMAAVLQNIDIRGTTMGSRTEFRAMVAFVAQAKIRPVVSRVVEGGLENLEGLEGLFEDMREGRQFGKLVLGMGGGSREPEGEGDADGDGRGSKL